jgi:protein-S-isoprenylcysteine O-methyltransferase Ste14
MWEAAVALVGLTLLSFAWSSLFYFRLAFARDVRKRWLAGSSLTSMAVITYTIGFCPSAPPAGLVAGIALLILSLMVFWGAIAAHGRQHPANAFVRIAPETIVRRGPYGVVRHPFYLSYLLFHVAATCLTGSWLVFLTIPWMAGVYFAAAREEERFFLNGPLAEAYAQFMAATGMFLPRLRAGQPPAAACEPAPARRDAA